MIIVSLLLAILLDIVFSEPKRFHPLVGFGAAANILESRVNRSIFPPFFQFLLGLVSWVLLVVVPALLIVTAVNYLSFYGDLSIFF